VRFRVALGVAAVLVASAAASAEDPDARVREQYVLHCSGCHGPDGLGVPGTTPSLHDLAPLLAAEGGRAYLARVPGVAQAPLSDRDLARLLGWVLAEFSGAAPEPPYDGAEIARWRRDPIRDTVAARAALISAQPMPGAP